MSDALYNRLPEDIRQADEAVAGTPLRALLSAVEEQADTLRAEIAQQYEDWFIETCAPGVIPYLGDLVGCRTPAGISLGSVAARRDVANYVHAGRRKGTLGVLETVARDVTGWNAIAFELEPAIATTYSPAVKPGARERTLDLRAGALLAGVHDIRSPAARGIAVRGAYAAGTVGLCVARTRAYRVSRSDAAAVTVRGDHCYTFDALGFDVPLVSAVQPLAGPLMPQDLLPEYGTDKSVAIWTRPAADSMQLELVPPERIVAADLQQWRFQLKPGQVAVDVERGRLAFAPGHAPSGAAVRYFYSAAADFGAGEYRRDCAPIGADFPIARRGGEQHDSLRAALARWREADVKEAAITFGDSHVYDESAERIELAPNQSLEIRAEDGTRPVLRFEGRGGRQLGGLFVRGGPGSSLVLDGLLIARGGIEIAGEVAQLTIRRCTLVPDECPITVHAPAMRLVIEQSIVGQIRTRGDGTEAAAIAIADSIVDAQGAADAIGASDGSAALVNLSVVRSTIFGQVRVHAVSQIENAIFAQPLWVRRRDVGSVRYSYLAPQSRTPHSLACLSDPEPTFMNRHYGTPGYGRLARACAPAIAAGEQDNGEPGAFFKSHNGRKADDLRRRLAEVVLPGVRIEIRYVGEV